MSPLTGLGEQVRHQYEKYPYPDYDRDWDKPQLLISGHLSLMNDVIWSGKKTLEGIRVLDAGCGTGSAMVAMAMSYPEADIVGVDFSSTSLDKARWLANHYKVKNIRFYNLPIEELPSLNMKFDFVSASGVLHHLADPAAGLKAMGDVLDEQGAISIMLYGKYGRTGIYMLQEALRTFAEAEETDTAVQSHDMIRFAHQLGLNVPSWHPMRQRSLGREMQEGKEAGIVDLLLHANDIPFDVPAVYKMCKDAGMRFYRWLFPVIYKLDNFFNDPFLLNRVEKLKMPHPEQEALSELVHGRNSKHSFIVTGPRFTAPDYSLSNGQWRKLHAKLTPCMAWNRTYPIQGKPNTFAIPFTIIQDAWGPLEVSRWQMMFLSQIVPEITLEDALKKPVVLKELPFKNENEIDRAVEELLNRALDRLAIVFLN